MPGPDTYYIIGKMHIEYLIPFIWTVNGKWIWGKYVSCSCAIEISPQSILSKSSQLAACNKAQTVHKEETLSHHRENNHSFLCVYNWGQPLKDNRRDWSGLVNCLWVCAPCFDSKVEIPCCGPGDESWISWENMTLRLFTLQATVSSSWQMRVNILCGVVLVHREMILVALLQPSFHLTLWGLG